MILLLKTAFLMIVAGIFGVLLGALAFLFLAKTFIELDFLAKILMGFLSISCWLVYVKLFQISQNRLGFKLKPIYLVILLIPSFFAIYVGANVFELISTQLFEVPVNEKYFALVHVLAYIGGLIGVVWFLCDLWPIILWLWRDNHKQNE